MLLRLQTLNGKDEESIKSRQKPEMFKEVALSLSETRTRTATRLAPTMARTARVTAWILRMARIMALILRTARWLDPPDLKWPDAARRSGDRH